MNSRNPRCHRIALSAVFVFLLGCENAPPKIETVILNRNPNPSVPLAAILTVATNEPTRAVVRLDDGERTWDDPADGEIVWEYRFTDDDVPPDGTFRANKYPLDHPGVLKIIEAQRN